MKRSSSIRARGLALALAASPLTVAAPSLAAPAAPKPAPSAGPPAPTPAAPPPATGPGEGGPQPITTPAGLLAETDEITRQVVALRGLTLKHPFARGVMSREEIGAKLRERMAKEYTPAEMRTEARVLKRLGLLPPDADYEKMLTDLLMEQVAGFYDPFAKKLYLADWLDGEMQRPAMAHEIEHALQDEHFDLKAFATPLKEDGDRQLARASLVEGDGTAVMLEFVAQGMGLDLAQLPDAMSTIGEKLAAAEMGQTQLARAPRVLRESLMFPYFTGLRFVMELRRGQPWSKVDQAFKEPPESTEQVMHAEKYVAHERPIAIAPAAVPSLAAKELRRDVLGEFEWKVILASYLPEGMAERAAAGWGGDRMVAWGDAAGEGPQGVVLADLSAWDSEEDAVEFEAAVRKLLARQTGRPEPAADRPAVFTVGSEAWSVERRGRDVLALFGAPTAVRGQAASEIWQGWRIGK